MERPTDAFQLFDAGWHITHMNPVARQFWAAHGMNPDSMIGKHFWEDLFPESRGGASAAYMYRAMEERVAVSFDYFHVPWGMWLRSRFDPLPDGGLANHFRDVTERQRPVHLHDDLLARLRLEFDRMPVACVVTDSDRRIMEWNPAAERIFGYPREEVLGRDGFDVLVPLPLRRHAERLVERLASGDMSAHAVNENLTKEGRRIVCEWHNTPLRDADGAVTAYLSMAQDVTERVRAEEALRESERNLAAELQAMARLQEVSTRLVRADDANSLLQEVVDAAIAITSANMGNIQLRDRASGTLEIVASRGFQEEFLDVFGTVQENQGSCGTAMTQGRRIIVEDVATSAIFADPRLRRVMLSAGARAVQSTPLLTRSGQLVGVLSTHYRAPHRPDARDLRLLDLLARQAADWIERKQAEEAGREREERYRSLVSQVKDYAIFSTDEHGVVTTWNEGCQQLLGYSQEEFVALDGRELFAPEDRTAGVLERNMRELTDSGATRDDRWMLAKGGRRFFSMGSAAARRDASGRLLGYSVILRDVTQMKLAQEELAHRGESLARLVTERTDALEKATEQLRLSERMASLGTLAAGLGHDLGNLLLPLDVRLQMLGQADLPPELQDHVAGIESCVHYLRRLSNGLRLLATSPSTPQPLEPTELREWWEEVGSLLKNVLPYGTVFEANVPRTECWVGIGRVSLTQAVFNLVQNAADALAGHGFGRVRVSMEDQPLKELIIMRITDNGPGMTEEVARRCMEPYFSTKARGVSTGMGLALVRALMTGAGGRVEIESTIGVGTTVSLLLHGAKHREKARAGRRRGSGRNVPGERPLADLSLRADVHGDVAPLPLIEP